jgi:hypothetical protein
MIMECGDCKQPYPKFFVVKDDLWVWHIPGPALLCLSCAEKTLGRPFQAEDFKPLAINRWVLELLDKRAKAASHLVAKS